MLHCDTLDDMPVTCHWSQMRLCGATFKGWKQTDNIWSAKILRYVMQTHLQYLKAKVSTQISSVIYQCLKVICCVQNILEYIWIIIFMQIFIKIMPLDMFWHCEMSVPNLGDFMVLERSRFSFITVWYINCQDKESRESRVVRGNGGFQSGKLHHPGDV